MKLSVPKVRWFAVIVAIAFGALIIYRVLRPEGLPLGQGRYESPVWSPDGSFLAFAFSQSGFPELWIFNVANKDFRKIDVNGRIFPTDGLAWQDNSTIWFRNELQGKHVLFWVNVVNNQSGIASDMVSWGWDGFTFNPEDKQEVIFSQTSELSTVGNPLLPDLYSFNLETKIRTRLTNTPEIGEANPVWSHDGSHLAWRWDGITILDKEHETHTIDIEIYPGFQRYAWSPNDQWFLYVGDDVDGRGLFLAASAENRKPARILSAPVLQVDWSPSSSYIAYTTVSTPGRGNELYIRTVEELGLTSLSSNYE